MDNQDVNKVELVGTLPRDAMFKQVGQNSVPLVSFTVMSTRSWVDPQTTEKRQSTQYINVSAWRNLADANAPLLKAGVRVKVIGEITSRSWDNPTTGRKEYKTEVVASKIEILEDNGSQPSGKSHDSIDPNDLPF